MAGKPKKLNDVPPGVYSSTEYAALAGISSKSIRNRINDLPKGTSAQMVGNNWIITVIELSVKKIKNIQSGTKRC